MQIPSLSIFKPGTQIFNKENVTAYIYYEPPALCIIKDNNDKTRKATKQK